MPYLLPDEDIREAIYQKIHLMESSSEGMELRWEKTSAEYLLEIVVYSTPQSDIKEQRIIVGRIRGDEYNALGRLIMAGRRLYFRLHGEFPMLRRWLSSYRYFSDD